MGGWGWKGWLQLYTKDTCVYLIGCHWIRLSAWNGPASWHCHCLGHCIDCWLFGVRSCCV